MFTAGTCNNSEAESRASHHEPRRYFATKCRNYDVEAGEYERQGGDVTTMGFLILGVTNSNE